MTNAEFRNAVKKSRNNEMFESQKFELHYGNTKYHITGLAKLYEFYLNQLQGWGSIDVNVELFKNSTDHFTSYHDKILEFFNSYRDNDFSRSGYKWSSFVSDFSEKLDFLTYDSPKVNFIVDISENDSEALQGVLNYFFGGYIDRESYVLRGFIKAYEFDTADKSLLSKRKTEEKRSFSMIRANMEKSQSTLQNKMDALHLKEIKRFEQLRSSIQTDHNSQIDRFNNWLGNSKKAVSDQLNAFKELTRLKEPAQYWKERGETLNKEGWKAIYWLAALVAFACITLYLLLWLTPEGMLLSFVKGNAQALKWSVVYVTFISFLAFGIRALNKVAFSSFHLARDAQERHQLTHVYLALVAEKDTDIKDEDRQLILQSLFSRSDSGLLKQDTSPTMPGNLVEKILKSAK